MILCEKALTLILSQEAAITEAEATTLLAYNSWTQSIQIPLLELFAAFATADLAVPKVPTVSQGVHQMCVNKKIELTKVCLARDDALRAAESTAGKDMTIETYRRIFTRLQSLPCPLYAISGKDFLIPLMEYHLKTLGFQIKRKSLRMRLVSIGDMDRFKPLAIILRHAAIGYV